MIGIALWLASADGNMEGSQPRLADPIVFEHARLSEAEAVLAQSLQGLGARPETSKSGPRVWLRAPGMTDAIFEQTYPHLKQSPAETDVLAAADRLRGLWKGIVVYKLGTPSLNAATSLAGPLRALAVDESLLPEAQRRGWKTLRDLRGTTEFELLDEAKLFSKSIAVEQPVDKPKHLRDFAIANDAFTFSAPNSNLRQQAARAFASGGTVFGWGPDEHQWIRDISTAGGTGVAADWCVNLSAIQALSRLRPATPVRPHRLRSAPKAEPNRRYVAFVMSDGDNIQWLLGGFAFDKNYFGRPLRGQFPMTWETAPILGKFAPMALQKLYDLASERDAFVGGPGLPSYVFPVHLPKPYPAPILREARDTLRLSGLRIGSVLNDNPGSMADAAPFPQNDPNLDAVLYKDYAPYHLRKGAIDWAGDRPIISYRFLLWEGLQGIEDLTKAISDLPTTGPLADRFALVNVHAWSYGSIGGPMAATQRVIDGLPEDVVLLTVPEAVALLREDRAKR